MRVPYLYLHMRQVFSLLLICCILGQASVRTMLVLHYQLNRAVYLRNCENKDKPSLHCDGKCYLKKQMGVSPKEDPNEPKLPDGFREIKDVQLFCESFDILTIGSVSDPQRQPMPLFQFTLPLALLTGVFRPPAAV